MENSTNQTNNVSVSYSPATRQAANIVLLFVYDIFPYPYFVLGVMGHSRSLYKCYQQSKTESGYLMQMFFSGIRIMEIMGFMLLIFAFNKWANVPNEDTRTGAPWFRRRYALMWFAAHLVIPLANAFITASTFMSVFISMDRVLALSRPLRYHAKWNKTRYRVGALMLSLSIGFILVSYDVGRMTVSYDAATGLYTILNNFEYRESLFASIFNVAKNCANFGGLAALVLCNVTVVRLYRSRVVNSGINRLIRRGSIARSDAEIRREEEQLQTQRTLFVLSVCQNVVATFTVGLMVTMCLLDYFIVDGPYRVSALFEFGWTLCDGALMLAVLLDFYVPVMVSKSLRRLMFPWCTKKNDVTPIGTNQQEEQQQPENAGVL